MKKNILIIIVVTLVIIVGGVYYWTRPKTTGGNQVVAVGEMPTAEVKAMLAKLQSRIILPTDEVPQIGQIDDPVQAAKIQPFVAGAQKGDLLIVYIKASRAIVYSPSRDLIVNVGPVSINPELPATPTSAETSTSTSTSTPVKK